MSGNPFIINQNNNCLFSENSNKIFSAQKNRYNFYQSNNYNNQNNHNSFYSNNNQNSFISFPNNSSNQPNIFSNNLNNQNDFISMTSSNNNNNEILFFPDNNNIQNNNHQSFNSLDKEVMELFTTKPLVLGINPNNYLKNFTLNQFPKEIQEEIFQLYHKLKNQELCLDEFDRYYQKLNYLLDENNKSVDKLNQFNFFISEKLNHYNQLFSEIKQNEKNISSFMSFEMKNIQLNEKNSGYKIETPSKYLIEYSQKLEKKTEEYKKRLNDVITLINIYNAQNNKYLNFDSDILESTVSELMKIAKYLVESTIKQEELINQLYIKIIEFSKDYGEDPYTIWNNINSNY